MAQYLSYHKEKPMTHTLPYVPQMGASWRKKDGSPAFVRTYSHPVSGRLVGVFADGQEIDAKAFQIECAQLTEAEVQAGSRPAPLSAAELEPGTVYYAGLPGGLTKSMDAKAAAALDWLTQDLSLPFALEARWFIKTDAAGYQTARFEGRFAEARSSEAELIGLHHEDTPDAVYLSTRILFDDDLLSNAAHEARHAWQAVNWPEAQRRGPAARERQERDARAYAARVVRYLKIAESAGGYCLARR